MGEDEAYEELRPALMGLRAKLPHLRDAMHNVTAHGDERTLLYIMGPPDQSMMGAMMDDICGQKMMSFVKKIGGTEMLYAWLAPV
jgi:hypothetical protein